MTTDRLIALGGYAIAVVTLLISPWYTRWSEDFRSSWATRRERRSASLHSEVMLAVSDPTYITEKRAEAADAVRSLTIVTSLAVVFAIPVGAFAGYALNSGDFKEVFWVLGLIGVGVMLPMYFLAINAQLKQHKVSLLLRQVQAHRREADKSHDDVSGGSSTGSRPAPPDETTL
ncbi:hypothetical protein [Phycicoccus flavus]|uniref:hypothetical protein n=1 Tax=Phycicoccus flavus TaxID=2502783 RepID=UPI000FEB6FD3|nr:hypothetical protein [Phycicoccus flavus]NHA69082.1 hypothetical protein [Phycicoccus flavus]